MTIDNPSRPRRSWGRYAVAIVVVAILAIVAASLWQADNSGTNSLSGDAHSTSPTPTVP
jgi:hypothetical protein